MKQTLGALAVALLLTLASSVAAAEEAWRSGEAELALPPASLAQWYKPANKRQVWLHTMFRLGMAMQAVKQYAAARDRDGTAKWAGILAEKYLKIAEMVPEWRDEVEEEAAIALTQTADSGDWAGLEKNLTRMGRTCRGCHSDFQVAAVALHRAPDFSRIEAGGEAFRGFMKVMKREMTDLKIAREDGRFPAAREAGKRLQERFRALGETCEKCHRDPAPRQRILGPETAGALADLIAGLKEPHDPKATGRLLGTVGYAVCGRCHGVHKNASALRRDLAQSVR